MEANGHHEREDLFNLSIDVSLHQESSQPLIPSPPKKSLASALQQQETLTQKQQGSQVHSCIGPQIVEARLIPFQKWKQMVTMTEKTSSICRLISLFTRNHPSHQHHCLQKRSSSSQLCRSRRHSLRNSKVHKCNSE